ncbi:MAG: penicillin-binding protein 2 [Candidatus Levybacteria bacterium]|nr:penicillin-binding protein 2 [Candidatus Levybacteria bacterium]
MIKIGAVFGENIKTEKLSKRTHSYGKNYAIRSFLLPSILFLAIGILIIRLFFLQISFGAYYRHLSDNNRIKTVVIHAPRGIIFDRNGSPLVFNVPGFREVPDGTSSTNEKTKLLTQEQALTFLAQGRKDLEIDSLRSYPYKDAFAHVLGYIGQISKDELQSNEFSNYRGGDLIGKIGIEKSYESKLKGIDGKQLVEVDSLGNAIRTLGQTDPIPGENITLTLNLNLQKAVSDAMKDVKKGAAIVSMPNGEILALVSKPSFDPNLFTFGKDYKIASESGIYSSISQILTDSENQPLINRTISEVYPPGSTFKLITAAAGLEDKIIDENFEITDTGIVWLGNFSFSNWYFTQYGKTDGQVNVVKGLQRSNDIFFYKLAEKVGVDKLSEMAMKFGLGQKLGIDISPEEAGTVPTPLWKEKVIGEGWYLGDTYHYGIGQGYLLTTPLQVNYWTQIIANGGTGYRPHLLVNPKSEILNPKFLSEKTISLIKQGMIESCSAGGVAWPFFELKVPAFAKASAGKESEKLKVACKTGTAQHGTGDTWPHAWITLFAPADNPQIIVTVLSESSGEGSNVAAPIAKKILEEWFSR